MLKSVQTDITSEKYWSSHLSRFAFYLTDHGDIYVTAGFKANHSLKPCVWVLSIHNSTWHVMFPPARMIRALCRMSEYHLCCTWREHRWDQSNVNRSAPAWDTVWQVSLQRQKHQAVSCKLWPFLLSLGTQCQSESVPVSVSEPTWLLGRWHYLINHILQLPPLQSTPQRLAQTIHVLGLWI